MQLVPDRAVPDHQRPNAQTWVEGAVCPAKLRRTGGNRRQVIGNVNRITAASKAHDERISSTTCKEYVIPGPTNKSRKNSRPSTQCVVAGSTNEGGITTLGLYDIIS